MINHQTVFGNEKLFAAWPAAYNMWAWGSEILCAFQVSPFLFTEHGHAYDRSKPRRVYLTRSFDGGKTWNTKDYGFFDPEPNPGDRHKDLLNKFDGKCDFTNGDHIMLHVMSGHRPNDFSWWYFSEDRGNTWAGPYEMPTCEGIDAEYQMRTRIIPIDADNAYLFPTYACEDGEEGRVACVLMTDGGRRFEFRSWIGNAAAGKKAMIMPEAIRRENGELVALIRCSEITNGSVSFCIEQYVSGDLGNSWHRESIPVINHGGNPPSLVRASTGEWILTYGCRSIPRTISARISEDEGRSWSREIILRECMGCGDMGYTRAVALSDGMILVTYYFNTGNDKERTIEATTVDVKFLKERAVSGSVPQRSDAPITLNSEESAFLK